MRHFGVHTVVEEDVDELNHVGFLKAQEIVARHVEIMRSETCLSINDLKNNYDLGLFITRINAKYFAEITLGEKVFVSIESKGVRGPIINFEAILSVATSNDLLENRVTIKFVMVLVNLKTKKIGRVPLWFGEM